MNVIDSLRKEYGYAPEWTEDKEFPHELWKDAFANLVGKLEEVFEENDAGDPKGYAQEIAYEVFCWAWYRYREKEKNGSLSV